jgi:hypothetical protein
LEIKPFVDRYDLSLSFEDREVFFNFASYPNIAIGCNQFSTKDIISVIELALERARQDQGIYCIHSSSVIYKGKAVLFWGGATGMGKTRMARLFMEKGASFYSDEKTLFSPIELEVVGGIGFQYLAKTYWKKNSSILTDPEESYIKIDVEERKKNFPIALFVYGFGIDGAEFSMELWESAEFEWHLYEELGRKIRAISRRVLEGKMSVPSIDSQENADRRVKNVSTFTKKIKCYSIQGCPEKVIEKVVNLLE